MLFEARLLEGSIWKRVAEALNSIEVDMANLDCTREGLHLQSMDSSHIVLVELRMNPDMFQRYIVKRNVSLGIKCETFNKLMKACKNSGDMCTFKHYEKDKEGTLHVMFEDKQQRLLRSFQMTLMDIDSEHMGIPQRDYTATVSIGAKHFADLCNQAAPWGDTLRISCSGKQFTIEARGDLGKNKFVINADGPLSAEPDEPDEDACFMDCKEPVYGYWAMNKIQKIAKGLQVSDRIFIQMVDPDESPLRFEARFGPIQDMDEDHPKDKQKQNQKSKDKRPEMGGTLSYYIAGKIRTETDPDWGNDENEQDDAAKELKRQCIEMRAELRNIAEMQGEEKQQVATERLPRKYPVAHELLERMHRQASQSEDKAATLKAFYDETPESQPLYEQKYEPEPQTEAKPVPLRTKSSFMEVFENDVDGGLCPPSPPPLEAASPKDAPTRAMDDDDDKPRPRHKKRRRRTDSDSDDDRPRKRRDKSDDE